MKNYTVEDIVDVFIEKMEKEDDYSILEYLSIGMYDMDDDEKIEKITKWIRRVIENSWSQLVLFLSKQDDMKIDDIKKMNAVYFSGELQGWRLNNGNKYWVVSDDDLIMATRDFWKTRIENMIDDGRVDVTKIPDHEKYLDMEKLYDAVGRAVTIDIREYPEEYAWYFNDLADIITDYIEDGQMIEMINKYEIELDILHGEDVVNIGHLGIEIEDVREELNDKIMDWSPEELLDVIIDNNLQSNLGYGVAEGNYFEGFGYKELAEHFLIDESKMFDVDKYSKDMVRDDKEAIYALTESSKYEYDKIGMDGKIYYVFDSGKE